jgi:hypothetical protein
VNPKPVLNQRQKINNFVLRGGLLVALGLAIRFSNGTAGTPITIALAVIGGVYFVLAALVWWRGR